MREGMMFVGRARLITHLMDEFGEEVSSEFSFDPKPPGFDPLLVFEFAPWRERTWWTYTTAGLSLCPAVDNHLPTELLAYSETQCEGLVDLLHQMAFRPEGSLAYADGDLIQTKPPDLGIPLGQDFGLIVAPERSEVMQFPNLDARPEDQRYIYARPGENAAQVQFLRVVALLNDDRGRWTDVRSDVEKSRAWKLF